MSTALKLLLAFFLGIMFGSNAQELKMLKERYKRFEEPLIGPTVFEQHNYPGPGKS